MPRKYLNGLLVDKLQRDCENIIKLCDQRTAKVNLKITSLFSNKIILYFHLIFNLKFPLIFGNIVDFV